MSNSKPVETVLSHVATDPGPNCTQSWQCLMPRAQVLPLTSSSSEVRIVLFVCYRMLRVGGTGGIVFTGAITFPPCEEEMFIVCSMSRSIVFVITAYQGHQRNRLAQNTE